MRHHRKGSSEAPGGIGFFGLLAVLFIGLKLTGYIGWSWWWVLAPIWGPLAVAAAICVACGAVILVARLAVWRRKGGAS